MEYREESITPDKAEKYLNRNTGNRKLRDGVVEKYAFDMKHGKWTDCPAPIVFYENGDIADGQHRLWAIVESKAPHKFIVVRGLSKEAGLNIDTGVSRTLVDNARISGIDHGLSNQLLSVARAMYTGERGGRADQWSNSKKLEVVNQYREACEWAVSNGPRGRALRNSIILAAVARAYLHVQDKDRLKRFCEVVSSGYSDGQHESAAVSVRNYMQSRTDVTSNHALWRETFLKFQNAIDYFMRGKQLTVIKSIKEEAYPLTKKKVSGK